MHDSTASRKRSRENDDEAGVITEIDGNDTPRFAYDILHPIEPVIIAGIAHLAKVREIAHHGTVNIISIGSNTTPQAHSHPRILIRISR